MQQNPPDPLKFFVIRDGAMMYGHMTAGPPVPDRDKPGVVAPAPAERPTVHQDSSRNETAILGLILRFQPSEEQPQPGQPPQGKFLVDVVAEQRRPAVPESDGDQLVQIRPRHQCRGRAPTKSCESFDPIGWSTGWNAMASRWRGCFGCRPGRELMPWRSPSRRSPALQSRPAEEIAE